MATNTPNFNLIKPDLTDIVDIADINDNMDIIDTALADAASVEVSTTPPTSPESGDLWWDSTEGALYVYYDDGDSAQWVSTAGTGIAIGHRYVSTVYFTSSGTLEKADYPWLRAIRVKCQGAGGGGGGCATTGATTSAVAGSGSGGAYAESFITNIAGLDASVTVTRGSGGAGGAAGNYNASAGGTSSFGSLVSAGGGEGGLGSAGSTANAYQVIARVGATTGTGDLVIPGGGTETSFALSVNYASSPIPGSSFLSPARRVTASATGSAGNGGDGVGTGGGGAVNAINQATARAGGAGANGIVIVELFA
jgi:hypothetical protein